MKNNISSITVALLLASSALVAVTSLTGCAGDRYNRSTGERIDDTSLNIRVKSALGDNPEYKFNDVVVNSFRGTVQLSGFVNAADQKTKAAQIAKHVEGVKDVENNISVKE